MPEPKAEARPQRSIGFWIKAVIALVPVVMKFRALPAEERKDFKKIIPLVREAIVALTAVGVTFGDLDELLENEDLLRLLDMFV